MRTCFRHCCLSVGCLLFFCAIPLAAQESPSCSSAITTAAMLGCQNTRLQKANQKLDEVYASLRKKLDVTGRLKLRVAEAAWLQFRKTNADFAADAARGGTMAPLLSATAEADMTEARAAELAKSAQLR